MDNRKRYRHPGIEGSEILVRPGQQANREAAGWVPVDTAEPAAEQPAIEQAGAEQPAPVTTPTPRTRAVAATEKES